MNGAPVYTMYRATLRIGMRHSGQCTTWPLLATQSWGVMACNCARLTHSVRRVTSRTIFSTCAPRTPRTTTLTLMSINGSPQHSVHTNALPDATFGGSSPSGRARMDMTLGSRVEMYACSSRGGRMHTQCVNEARHRGAHSTGARWKHGLLVQRRRPTLAARVHLPS